MDLNEVAIFARVAQSGSFTAAARALGLPKSTVSRKVSALERRLGVVLLQRTTRKLNLTEAGDAYFRKCAQLLSELEEAEKAVTTTQGEPQGLLRVTAPIELGNTVFGDIAARFVRKYSKVELDVLLTDRIVDLVGEGVDLAVRAGELEDSSLVARKIGQGAIDLYASPAYLKKHGRPLHPRDLTKHSCLHFTNMSEKPVWDMFSKTGAKYRVTVPARVRGNNFTFLRELALTDAGIAMLPTFVCAEDVKKGRLVRVLPDWHWEDDPIYAVYPQQRFVAPKLRVFVDFLIENCSGIF